MKYSIAKMKAHEFANERKEVIRIAKANKKEQYCVLVGREEPTANYTVVETVAPAIISASGKPIQDDISVVQFSR